MQLLAVPLLVFIVGNRVGLFLVVAGWTVVSSPATPSASALSPHYVFSTPAATSEPELAVPPYHTLPTLKRGWSIISMPAKETTPTVQPRNHFDRPAFTFFSPLPTTARHIDANYL
jgi:hypothetical protein